MAYGYYFNDKHRNDDQRQRFHNRKACLVAATLMALPPARLKLNRTPGYPIGGATCTGCGKAIRENREQAARGGRRQAV